MLFYLFIKLSDNRRTNVPMFLAVSDKSQIFDSIYLIL